MTIPTIEGYTGLEPIGAGGIGDVYRAVDIASGTVVAIKLLRDINDRSVAWHRTQRELHALRALGGHPNVIQVIDLVPNTPGLVMDYAPGGSVSSLLADRGPTLPVPEIALIGRDTAAALCAAHEQGIIHRDVKPQNLLVDADGRIRLCDFGIASLTRSEEFRTRTNARSMRYASPEDLEEDVPVGPATDMYSLGATLIHLLRGSPPSLKDRLSPWVPTACDDPDRSALEHVVAGCLHPDPALRPTPAGFLADMETFERRLAEPCRGLAVRSVPGSVAGTTSDDTVHRTGRPHPTIERPDDPPRRGAVRSVRRTSAIANQRQARRIGAVGTVLIVTVGALLITTRSGDRVDRTGPAGSMSVPVTTQRPPGLIAVDDSTVIWPSGPVGECLLQVAERSALQVVPCDSPHDLERYGTGKVQANDFPNGEFDIDHVDRIVEAKCLATAPATAPTSSIRLATSAPTVEAWASGDHTFQCFLGVPGRRKIGALAD